MSSPKPLLLAVCILLVAGCSPPASPTSEQAASPTSPPTLVPESLEAPTSVPSSPTPSPEPSPVSTPARPPITLDNASQLASLAPPLELDGPVTKLVQAPDGTLPVATGETGHIYSIAPDSSAYQEVFVAPEPVRALAVDRDATMAVGTVGGEVLIVDMDGTIRQTIRLSDAGVPVNALAYAPNGSTLAAALNNGTIAILDPANGATPQTLAAGSPVRTLIFSSDGAILITAGDNGFIRYWDTDNGNPLFTGDIGHGAPVHSLALTRDGIILASGGADAEIKIFDGYSAQWLNTLLGHTASVEALAFSPDGILLASGDKSGRLIIWDVVIGEPLITIDAVHAGGISGLAFSPDGLQLVTSGTDGMVQWWGIPME